MDAKVAALAVVLVGVVGVTSGCDNLDGVKTCANNYASKVLKVFGLSTIDEKIDLACSSTKGYARCIEDNLTGCTQSDKDEIEDIFNKATEPYSKDPFNCPIKLDLNAGKMIGGHVMLVGLLAAVISLLLA